MRKSLLAPVPELEVAATLLEAAAVALMDSNEAAARDLIVRADLPEIREYAVKLVGRMSVTVHLNTKRPTCLPTAERDATRMPPVSQQNAIFARDGWRCRFCETKVVSKSARLILVKRFPRETRWSGPEFSRHSALYAMASSLDHVIPHGQGGKNEWSNFVTACYCCQFGRGEWTLEQMQLLDPREREPTVDAWDGLDRLGDWIKRPAVNSSP